MAADARGRAHRGVSHADERGTAGRIRSAPCGCRDSGHGRRRPAQAASSAPQPERPVHHAAAPPPPVAERTPGPRFASERGDRDDFVRKATLDRFRAALVGRGGSGGGASRAWIRPRLHGQVEEAVFTGGRASGYARARFVPQVDAAAVAGRMERRPQKAATPRMLRVPDGQRSGARHASCRTRSPSCGSGRRGQTGISVIPIDVRDWSAHIPADAPAACRNLIKRLREAGN